MGTNEKPNVFNVLNVINVNKHTEKKGNLTYLSWAFAWQVTKQNFPNAQYKVYENNEGWNYFTDGRTAWVKVSVTINELEHIEYLPIMDFRNKSIPIGNVTSFEVNKAIQRALTKAIARHGLGLYIYAGEDLPSEDDGSQNIQPHYKTQSKSTEDEKKAYWNEFQSICKGLSVNATEFLHEWCEATEPKAIQNIVSKYLKDKDTFVEQIENYKAHKMANV